MKRITLIISTLAFFFFAQAQDMKGMDMNKKETKQQPVTYACPMHPDIHSDRHGKCPKCGMALVKQKTREQKKKMTSIYTCPMHPEMHSDKAGSCFKCKMALVKSEPAQQMENMDMVQKGDMQMGEMGNMPSAKMGTIPDKFIINNEPPKVTHYDLYVADTVVDFSGKKKRAIAVNGQIPMPALTFVEGDTAEIVVHNNLKEGTTLHWHGLFLNNQYDGVSYLTQPPIPPGESYTYRFPIKQSGTHWYHSHFELQEQLGMYGSMTLLSRKELDIPTIPIVLSEWSDVNPKQIHRRLYAADDWFSIRKKSTQSYWEAIKSGYFKTKLTNEWKRMSAMDVSDIYYEKFLINGKQESVGIPKDPGAGALKAGDKIRLRIANGGASSYFWLTYSGGKITVVANDGNDVMPIEVDRLIIGVSETYDVVVTIPENKQYEFLVTPEDRTKHASLWLGSGEKVPAKKLERLKYYAGMKMMNNMMDMKGNVIEMQAMAMQNQVMDMNTVMYPEITGKAGSVDGKMMKMIESNYDKTMRGDTMNNMRKEEMQKDTGMMMKHGGHKMKEMDHSMHGMNMKDGGMQMTNEMSSMMDMDAGNSNIVTLNYNMLRSPGKTTLPIGDMRTLRFDLTGNMDRYVWTLDNKTISESDKILIKKGENLRIILYNNSMMRHPMHLHGHDFRLLNGQGEYAPLKNVVDIMPMERDTLEWAANADGGDWFFHCHLLYHMMSGMGRVFSYEDGKPNPEIVANKGMYNSLKNDDRKFHLMGNAALQSNGSDGMFMLSNTRFSLNQLWHLGYHDEHGYESETMFGRYLGRMQWWFPYAGFDYHYKKNDGSKNLFGNEAKTLFGQSSNKLNRKTVTAGIIYTLPMLVKADARIDGNGQFRFQLSREDITLAPRIRGSWMINSDKEYMAGLSYKLTKYFSAGTHYDSDMGWGAGIIFNY